MSWVDASDASIKFQRYGASGAKAGSETEVTLPVTLAFPSEVEVVAVNGGFVAAFIASSAVSGIGRSVYTQRFSNTGTPIDAQPNLIIQTANDQTQLALSKAGGGFYLASKSGTNILGALVSAGGVPDAPINIDGTADAVQSPAVAFLSSTLAAVVYDNTVSGHIESRLFNPTNGQLGTLSLVSSVPNEAHADPVIAVLANGNLVIAWEDAAPSGPGSVGGSIKARILASTGLAVTGEFIVQTMPATLGFGAPDIITLPDGGFVITYTAELPDVVLRDLRIQAFNMDGTRRGSEFSVNAGTDEDQSGPSITALADGRLVVAWTDNAGGTDDIRHIVLDPRDGVVTGTLQGDNLFGHDGGADEIIGFGGNDTLSGLRGNDMLRGGDGDDDGLCGKGDDVAYGGNGNDFLIGSAGDDDLFGDAGDDNLRGNTGEDLLDGGVGSDFASYATEATGAMVFLDGSGTNAGSASGDSYVSIENVSGADLGNDSIRGNNAGNRLFGNGGSDVLVGLDGADTLRGGAGIDTLSGGADADTFEYLSASEGGDTITSFSSLDFFAFRGSAFGGLAAGALEATRFVSRATDNLAQNTTQRFIYQENTDQLWFDPNGSTNGAANAVLIANITANAAVTAADIQII